MTLRNRDGDMGDTDLVMQFRVVRRERDESELPQRLADVEPLDPSSAALERSFDFRRGPRRDGSRTWAINGELFDPGRVDADPRLGTTEVWEIRGNAHHPFHMHLVQFQVLGRSSAGDRPGPFDAGWKDTVDVRGGERVRVIARFTGYRGRYVFHCHNLEHEDMAMMANVDVV